MDTHGHNSTCGEIVVGEVTARKSRESKVGQATTRPGDWRSAFRFVWSEVSGVACAVGA